MTQFVLGGATRTGARDRKSCYHLRSGTELQMFVDVTSGGVSRRYMARQRQPNSMLCCGTMLTTAAMVRIGKTYGNLMVDVQTGSEKARDRARRIITIVTGLEYDDADKLLRRARWNVKAAIVMQKSGLTYTQAVSRLRRAHGSVRDAIGEDASLRSRNSWACHDGGRSRMNAFDRPAPLSNEASPTERSAAG